MEIIRSYCVAKSQKGMCCVDSRVQGAILGAQLQ